MISEGGGLCGSFVTGPAGLLGSCGLAESDSGIAEMDEMLGNVI